MLSIISHVLSLIAFAYLLVYALTRSRETNRRVVAYSMIDSADPDCKHCNGTGWAPCFQERAMMRCGCHDPQREPGVQ